MKESNTEILVVGGGLGGVAAALAAARLGKRVVLTEETDWIGGQLTAQGVPPDEHSWIEMTGCTRSYQELRRRIREFYRDNYPLLPAPRADPQLNPGMGFVSRLCAEPRASLSALLSMIAPYQSSHQIELLLEYRPIEAVRHGDLLQSVKFVDRWGDHHEINASYVLDATELGDVVELGDIDHVIGAESHSETGELHALPGDPDPLDQQAISWCFAVDYLPDEDHTISKPDDYDFWYGYQADFWPEPQLSWTVSDAITGKPLYRPLFAGPTDSRVAHDLWHFRRMLYREHYPPGTFPSDIVLLNVAAIDYWLDPLIGVDEQRKERALRGAKQLSLSYLYWMQTDAPRHDGGNGYPGLRLRGDVFGTRDSLAKFPYIRESRRIKAEFTVLEQHIGVEARPGAHSADHFPDSVGIGAYRIDLHPSTAGRNYIDVDTWPFEIPLGALIPRSADNLIAAGKNIGTTHITNGAYRLHPVEWNIGEVAGAVAAYCLTHGLSPRDVRQSVHHLSDFQRLINQELGIPVAWPEFAPLGPDKRHGSPSALYGGVWTAEGPDDRMTVSDWDPTFDAGVSIPEPAINHQVEIPPSGKVNESE